MFFDHILQAAVQTGKPLEELLEKVRESGIEAVEINMTYLCEHEDTYELLNNAGLLVSCIYEFYEMDCKDDKEKAKKHIDTALKAGAGRILVVPGFLSDKEAKQMKEYVYDFDKMSSFLSSNEKCIRMAEGLDYIVSLAGNCDESATKKSTDSTGIEVTIEDFDDEKSPISSLNGMLWFLRRIPGLKCTFDTGNFIIHGEDVLTAWEALEKRVAHIHCKDRDLQPVAVGNGYIPINTIIGKAKNAKYDGYLAIEHFDAEGQEKCIAKSAMYLSILIR